MKGRSLLRLSATGTAALAASTAIAMSSSVTESSAAVAKSTNASCIPAAPSSLPGAAAKTVGAVGQQALMGYPGTVYKSPWANMKAKKGKSFEIGFSQNLPGSTFASGVLAGLQHAQKSHSKTISKVIALSVSTPNSVTEQIQDIRTLLNDHVAVIFALLASPTGLNQVIDEAAKQGVPVISVAGQSTDKNAINLQANPVDLGYYGAAGLVNAMGGKSGNVLDVQGIPGVSLNTYVLNAGNKVLAACKDTIVNTLTGDFQSPIAKAATLQFLAGNPGTINGVFQTSGMASGVISAFQQQGRSIPPVADVNPEGGSLVYWKQNISSYKGSGVAESPMYTGEYGMALALALIDGRGIKITDVPFKPPVITASNLSSYISAGWTTATVDEAEGPQSALPITALVHAYTTKK